MSSSSYASSLASGSAASLAFTGSNAVGGPPRFDGKAASFPAWKFLMRTWMLTHKLLDVLERPLPSSAAGALASAIAVATAGASAVAAAAADVDAPAQGQAGVEQGAGVQQGDAVRDSAEQEWRERADRAYGVLIMSLAGAPTMLSLAQRAPSGDAHAVWTMLQGRFERKTIANQAAALEQLMALRSRRGHRLVRGAHQEQCRSVGSHGSSRVRCSADARAVQGPTVGVRGDSQVCDSRSSASTSSSTTL